MSNPRKQQSYVIEEGDPSKNDGQPGMFLLYCHKGGNSPLYYVARFDAVLSGHYDRNQNALCAELTRSALESTGINLL